MKSAEKMKVITKHVERSSQEQARGSTQITRSIESISEMVNHLNRAQKDQTRGSELVVRAVEQIRRVAEAQAASVKDLELSIADLAEQARVLRGEVTRFKVNGTRSRAGFPVGAVVAAQDPAGIAPPDEAQASGGDEAAPRLRPPA
jgi:hypothetical protein